MEALGIIEVNSVPVGFEIGDVMLKAAATDLVSALPVCPGKFVIVVRGEVAAVTSAVQAGEGMAVESLVDSLIIPSVHPQVFEAMMGVTEIEEKGAFGSIETFSLAATIYGADQAVKAAEVNLIEIRLGRGLGGKSYVTLTGDVAAVNEAVKIGVSAPQCAGMISRSVVIPSPHPSIWEALL